MKNKIKGLLALVLSVLIGQVWAATPVATWTDFNTLTSGNYTITKGDGCTVNDDGSITLGGAGLELSFSAGQPAYDNNSITVVMDVSNVPSDAKLVDVTTNGQSDNLYYGTDGKLYQRAGTVANYGNCAWTAERATIAFAYGAGGGNTTGTTTYINGVKSIDANNLKWTGSGRYVTKVAFPATGMRIHSIRVYGTKLSAAEIPASVPMAAFGVNFMYGTGQELTVGGFEKGLHNAPAKWLNVTGSANGTGTIGQYNVAWSAFSDGVWNSDCSTDTAAGKLLYGYLDDCINSGRVKATVTITGLPTDKKYAAALILSGDGANNTDANGKFSPALINGETYSYVNGDLVTGDTAKAATTWGDRSKAAAAAGLVEGTNVMFVEGLTGETLTITSALDAWGVSRLTIAGVQVWIMGDTILTVPAEGLTYTEDMAINREVSGTGTLTADNCTLDVTEAMMNGCSLAAQNNGVIVLKADQLDTIGGLTIPQGATVKIITDAIDAVIAGEATFAMPENTTIAGTVTLVTLDGEKEATAEIADGILTAKFTANPTVVGSTWWWDYEFNGNGNNTGSEGTNLKWDGDRPLKNGAEYTEAEPDGNQMLKLPSRPWRDVSIWPTSATFVMKAKAGTQSNGILVAFGSSAFGTTKTITLMTGENPENGDMRLVLTTGKNSLIDLVENLSVPNATTSYHLYAFTLETVNGKTTICVYVDGELLATYTSDSAIALGTGLQIASVHGGPPTGLNRLADEDTATMDFLRVTDSILSEKALKAMAGAYPYVSPNGKATRTVVATDVTWAGVDAETPWLQMTLNEDATSTTVAQAAPNTGTEVEITVNETTSLALNNEAVVYETLTITGDGALSLTSDETNTGTIQVSGRTRIETDVTVSPSVKIGAVTVADGCTLTFDYSSYDFSNFYVDATIPLTGLADMGTDASVEVELPEMPEWVTTAEPVFDPQTKTWSLVITMAGELTAIISQSGNWDSITWKVGDLTIAQPNLEVLETMPLIVSADATLTMNKAVTVKNLTISGEGDLIIAENGGNKLTVSGATTINANVTATAGAAALGSITINEGNSLAIKEKINNVGTIASNAGVLVYMGGNITEDKQLTNAIGAIRIATGTVNFTKANGDYTSGAITIDNGATMKVSEGQHNSFGNSPITNNGAIVSTGSGAHLYPVVSGTGTLTVESGVLTLHGANTYQGGTTVAGGTLVVSGSEGTSKVLPEGKTVTVNANATIQLVAGLSFVTIEGEGKTLVTGTYTYGIAGAKGVASDLTTKTVEVAEGGVLQFRAWRAYALTIDSLIVNGTLKSEGYDGSDVPTVTVAQGQKLSGTGTIEIPVTLADGALVGNAEVVPATAVVQGSVTCDTAEVATALAEKLTPPTGYHFNVVDKVLSIALNKVTVALPAVQNAVWKDAEGNTITSITVDQNSSTSVKLETTGDYVFADGSTSKDVTIASGDADSEATAPADASIVAAGAKIGDKLYTSFAAAFAAAQADDTITLLAGVTINSRLDIAQNVTIDLNGQAIAETMEDQFGAIYVKKGATLTIAATNGGEITTDGGIVIGNYGNVVVNGGTIAAGEDAEADVSIYNFYYHADWYGTTTINGGTVARIWNCGVATLAGGEVTDVDNSGAMEITEYATVDNIILRDGTDAPGIEGAGTLTAPEGLTVTTMDGQTVVYADGKYTVVAIPVSNNVAKIGDEEFETLEAAFTAAKEMTDPVTVTLLKDIGSEDDNKVVALPANKEIDFNLNDKTIYGRIKIENDGVANVTIRNGKILNTTGTNAVWIYGGNINLVNLYLRTNYHGLRLENTASAIVNGGDYAITRNGAYSLLYAKGSSTLEVLNGSFIPLSEPEETYAVQGVAGTTVKIKGGTFKRTVRGLGEFVVSGGRFTETTYVRNSLAVGCMLAQKDSDGYYPVVKANYVLTVNAENAEVSELNATYQYEDEVSFTVTPAAGYKVTSVKLGTDELTADANGNYTFKMPASAATITVTVEAESTFDVTINGQPVADADALKAAANSTTTMTVPETSTWTAEGNVLKKDGEAYVEFADYYTVVVNGTTVTLKLNKPVIGDSAEGADDAFTVTANAVTIKITNYNSALKYGVRTAADINGLKTAEIAEVETDDGVITLTKSGDSAFFEVVVSDVPFAE